MAAALLVTAAALTGGAQAQDRQLPVPQDGAAVSEHSKNTPPQPAPAQPALRGGSTDQIVEQEPPAKQPAGETAGRAAQPEAPSKSSSAAPPPVSPLGKPSPWEVDVKDGPGEDDKSQNADNVSLVRKVNDYFNNMRNLEGRFLQTDPDDKKKKGKFYFERPGKVRFDYALPSKLRIVSNGQYLAIEDHDLNTSDRYPIDSTPFRLLLAKDVDLLRDARILGIESTSDLLVVSLEDRSRDAAGQIRLFFSRSDMHLKQWIITDPQGLNTRIEVADLEVNKKVAPDLFKFSDIALPKFNQ